MANATSGRAPSPPIPCRWKQRLIAGQSSFHRHRVDGEVLFNEKTLVLYFLGTPTDDLGVLASELGQGREFNVLFNSVLEVAAPVASCGCSGGGCGAK